MKAKRSDIKNEVEKKWGNECIATEMLIIQTTIHLLL